MGFFVGRTVWNRCISEEDGATKSGAYNPVRGAKVVAYARNFLDQAAPLAKGSHKDSVAYTVDGNKLSVKLKDGSTTGLADEKQFVGYQGDASAPSSVLLRNNGVHIDIEIDKSKPLVQAGQQVSMMSFWKQRCPPFWIWKIRLLRLTPMTKLLPTKTGLVF